MIKHRIFTSKAKRIKAELLGYDNLESAKERRLHQRAELSHWRPAPRLIILSPPNDKLSDERPQIVLGRIAIWRRTAAQSWQKAAQICFIDRGRIDDMLDVFESGITPPRNPDPKSTALAYPLVMLPDLCHSMFRGWGQTSGRYRIQILLKLSRSAIVGKRLNFATDEFVPRSEISVRSRPTPLAVLDGQPPRRSLT